MVSDALTDFAILRKLDGDIGCNQVFTEPHKITPHSYSISLYLLIPQAAIEGEIKQIIEVMAEAESILGMIFQRVNDASEEVDKQVAAFDLGEKKKSSFRQRNEKK